jgi:hypothetical protein
MIKHKLAVTILLLASACGSRTAAPDNKTANQVAPQPVVAPTNSVNSAAAVTPKPQQQSAPANTVDPASAGGDANGAPTTRSGRGCAAETSLGAAEEMVRICRDVSPATHPPCNIENSCATIRNEINRGCRLLGDDAPADCRGG